MSLKKIPLIVKSLLLISVNFILPATFSSAARVDKKNISFKHYIVTSLTQHYVFSDHIDFRFV